MPWCRDICIGASALLVIGPSQDAAALVAACPDGSVYFAKKWEDVHCLGAVVVPPGAVPPLGVLQNHRSRARQAFLRRAETKREWGLEAQIDELRTIPTLALTTVERHRLARFIERSQQYAAAAVERDVRGLPPLEMRLAHSRAFEARLVAAGRPVPGLALVFSLAPAPAGFKGLLPSFAQSGITFRPSATDRRQFDWITGDGPDRDDDAPKLGYVVLPREFDPTRPLVLFWGDAVVVARLWGVEQ